MQYAWGALKGAVQDFNQALLKDSDDEEQSNRDIRKSPLSEEILSSEILSSDCISNLNSSTRGRKNWDDAERTIKRYSNSFDPNPTDNLKLGLGMKGRSLGSSASKVADLVNSVLPLSVTNLKNTFITAVESNLRSQPNSDLKKDDNDHDSTIGSSQYKDFLEFTQRGYSSRSANSCHTEDSSFGSHPLSISEQPVIVSPHLPCENVLPSTLPSSTDISSYLTTEFFDHSFPIVSLHSRSYSSSRTSSLNSFDSFHAKSSNKTLTFPPRRKPFSSLIPQLSDQPTISTSAHHTPISAPMSSTDVGISIETLADTLNPEPQSIKPQNMKTLIPIVTYQLPKNEPAKIDDKPGESISSYTDLNDQTPIHGNQVGEILMTEDDEEINLEGNEPRWISQDEFNVKQLNRISDTSIKSSLSDEFRLKSKEKFLYERQSDSLIHSTMNHDSILGEEYSSHHGSSPVEVSTLVNTPNMVEQNDLCSVEVIEELILTDENIIHSFKESNLIPMVLDPHPEMKPSWVDPLNNIEKSESKPIERMEENISWQEFVDIPKRKECDESQELKEIVRLSSLTAELNLVHEFEENELLEDIENFEVQQKKQLQGSSQVYNFIVEEKMCTIPSQYNLGRPNGISPDKTSDMVNNEAIHDQSTEGIQESRNKWCSSVPYVNSPLNHFEILGLNESEKNRSSVMDSIESVDGDSCNAVDLLPRSSSPSEMSQEISGKISQETPGRISQEIPEGMSQEIPERMSQEIPERMSQEIPLKTDKEQNKGETMDENRSLLTRIENFSDIKIYQHHKLFDLSPEFQSNLEICKNVFMDHFVLSQDPRIQTAFDQAFSKLPSCVNDLESFCISLMSTLTAIIPLLQVAPSNQTRSDVSSCQREIEFQKRVIDELQTEIEKLRNHTTLVTDKAAETFQRYRDEIEEQQEIEKQAHRKALESSVERYASLMSQYKQLQHAGNEQVGIESVLQERIERIEMENYDLNEQLESWQRAYAQVSETYQRLIAEAAELRHRCFTLETMVEELEGSRKIIEEQKRLLEDSKLTEIQLQIKSDLVERLQSDLTDTRDVLNRLNRLMDDVNADQDVRVTGLEMRLVHAQRELTETKSKLSEMNEKNDELKTKQEDCENLKKEIESIRAVASKKEQQNEVLSGALKKVLDRLHSKAEDSEFFIDRRIIESHIKNYYKLLAAQGVINVMGKAKDEVVYVLCESCGLSPDLYKMCLGINELTEIQVKKTRATGLGQALSRASKDLENETSEEQNFFNEEQQQQQQQQQEEEEEDHNNQIIANRRPIASMFLDFLETESAT